MPTVILLDVSLSMCRNVGRSSSGELLELRQLANHGVGALLDYFAQNAQLEQTALVIFSTLWEVRQPFTRHHEVIKNRIYDLDIYSKSNVVNAIRGVLSLKLHDWIQNGPINIVLVTDGLVSGHVPNESSPASNLAKREADEFVDSPLSDLEGLFDLPCKIQVVCLALGDDPILTQSIPFYRKLVSHVDQGSKECPVIKNAKTQTNEQSAIWLPTANLDSGSPSIGLESVENLFLRLADHHYKPYHATLNCGGLSSIVMLSPRPTECILEPLKNEFDALKMNESQQETYVLTASKKRFFNLCNDINICGFMTTKDVASPAVKSRHVMLPVANRDHPDEIQQAEQVFSRYGSFDLRQSSLVVDAKNGPKVPEGQFIRPNDNSDLSEQDLTKIPSFCTLLHNGLKQESMCAVCIVGRCNETGDDWFGLLHSHVDSKKRSVLMLSLLTPGPNPVLWLPSFQTMGSISLTADLHSMTKLASSSAHTNKTPVKSYSSNGVIWLDPEAVRDDVQKIVRHAKRAPDKAPYFYKELNRIRRAAISYGFYDVLFGLANILDRERKLMEQQMQSKGGVNPETLAHIDHVVTSLRACLNEDSYDTNISPPTLPASAAPSQPQAAQSS